jgi:anti-sigma B factor antagonist
VACLVEGLQAAKQKNLTFSLAAVNAKVLRVLEVARLDKVFTIFDSVEEAVAA